MKTTADFPTTSTSPLPPDAYAFDYTIGVTLWLTRADIDLLILCAKHHYDGVCQEMGLAGGEQSLKSYWKASRNGKLVILRDAYLSDEGERTAASLTQREIDTMLKILEMRHFVPGVDMELAGFLQRRLQEAFQAINCEYYRLRLEKKSHAFSP